MLTAGGMRAWRAALLAMAFAGPAAILAIPAHPALAANQTITAAGGLCTPPGTPAWTNANPTISVGDTVTWNNCAGGNHSLRSYSSGWCLPFNSVSGTSGSNWSYSCKFTAAGSYSYWCGVHGSSMSGTVTVQGSAPPPPPPPPTPAPTHSQPPAPQPPAATPPPQAAAPSPKPSVPGDLAVAPSPSPTDTPSPSPSASAAPAVNSTPASSAGGSGSPLPLFVAGLAVVALGSGGFYWYRSRKAV